MAKDILHDTIDIVRRNNIRKIGRKYIKAAIVILSQWWEYRPLPPVIYTFIAILQNFLNNYDLLFNFLINF